jgi:hypothetical protein
MNPSEYEAGVLTSTPDVGSNDTGEVAASSPI